MLFAGKVIKSPNVCLPIISAYRSTGLYGLVLKDVNPSTGENVNRSFRAMFFQLRLRLPLGNTFRPGPNKLPRSPPDSLTILGTVVLKYSLKASQIPVSFGNKILE